jgi:hypothetical protein
MKNPYHQQAVGRLLDTIKKDMKQVFIEVLALLAKDRTATPVERAMAWEAADERGNHLVQMFDLKNHPSI